MRKTSFVLLLIAWAATAADVAMVTYGLPAQFSPGAAGPSVATLTADSTNAMAATVFQCADAVTITQLGFSYGTRLGTPPTYRLTLQGVNASTGAPDGVPKQGAGGGSLSVTGATNATPIEITVSGSAPATGTTVWISSVGGNTAANGLWPITNTGASTFTLTGSVGNGTYTSGGTVLSNAVGVVFTPPADTSWNSTFRWTSLASSSQYTCTRGQLLAWVLKHNNGTVDASNRSAFTYGLSNTVSRYGFPHPLTSSDGGSSWTKQSAILSSFGYASATKAYGRPVVAITQTTISTTSEQALAFSLPSTACSTFKVAGAEGMILLPATGKTFNMTIYEGTTARQGPVTFSSDTFTIAAASRLAFQGLFTDSSLYTFSCGTTYYLGFAPQEASSNFSLLTFDSTAAADLAAWPGGTGWYSATRASGGGTAFSEVTTSRPTMGLILSDITPATCGGGGAKTCGFSY